MKGGFPSSTGTMVTCPACGKRQRLASRDKGSKWQCGQCREKIVPLTESPAAGAPETDLKLLCEKIRALENLVERVEAVERSISKIMAATHAPAIPVSQRTTASRMMNFASRLEKCRPGKLTVNFAQDQAAASEHAAQLCQLFTGCRWTVDGPCPSASGRAGTTFAVGALPMTPALADLFMALGASGVEVVSILDQNLAADEARLTLTNDTARLVPESGRKGDSVEAA